MRELSDEEFEKKYDEAVSGYIDKPDFYRDELRRRNAEKHAKATSRLAWAVVVVGFLNFLSTIFVAVLTCTRFAR